jgi:glucose dehydrogenase
MRANGWLFVTFELATLVWLARFGPKAANAAEDRPFSTWHEHLGGADSSQYSSLRQINKSNVKQLQVVWT